MTDLGPKCDHSCEAGHRPIKPAEVMQISAIDTTERGRKRARAKMSPETRKIWDELSQSVEEFKKAALERKRKRDA